MAPAFGGSLLLSRGYVGIHYILEIDYMRKAPESLQGPIFYFRVLHAAIVDNMRSMIIKDLYVLFVSVEVVEEIFSSLR